MGKKISQLDIINSSELSEAYIPAAVGNNNKKIKITDHLLVKSSLSEYSPTDHTHSEYALVDHTHSGYALSTHSHSGYATIESPTFTGTPTVPEISDDSPAGQIANKKYVDEAISKIEIPGDTDLSGYATTTYVQSAVLPKQDKNVGTADMVLVTDADGNITSSSVISTTELNALEGYTSGADTIENRLFSLEQRKRPFVKYNNKTYLVGSFDEFESWDKDKNYTVTVSEDALLFMYFYTGSSDGVIEEVLLTIGTVTWEWLKVASGTEIFTMPFESGTILTFGCKHNFQVKIIQVPYK